MSMNDNLNSFKNYGNESKLIKCCEVKECVEMGLAMFHQTFKENAPLITNEIARYGAYIMAVLELKDLFCKECLKYKKEMLDPAFPNLKKEKVRENVEEWLKGELKKNHGG